MAINRVSIVGNLTRDAQLLSSRDGQRLFIRFGVAINERRRNEQTGAWESTNPVYVECSLFGPRAESLQRSLTKGTKVAIDGRLAYHSYLKNDERRSYLSVVVNEIEFLSRRPDLTAMPTVVENGPQGAGAHMAPASDLTAPTPVQPPAADLYDEDIDF